MEKQSFFQRAKLASSIFIGRSPYENANSSPVRQTPKGAKPQDQSKDFSSAVQSELVRRSRYLSRNSAFYEKMAGEMATYAVGTGIKPQSTVENEDWASQAEAYFTRWGKNADVTNRFNLTNVLTIVCKAIDVDGEIFVVRTRNEFGDAKVQLLETHRLKNFDDKARNIHNGIQTTSYGRPINYFFEDDEGNEVIIPANAVSHIYEPSSASMLRYPPTAQHGINNILDINELLSFEKKAVKDNSGITRVLKSNREDALDDGDFNIGEEVPEVKEPTNPEDISRYLGGNAMRINTDEDLSPFESNRPNSTFTGFIDHLLKDSSGKLPYELLHDTKGVGSAAIRFLLAKSERVITARQQILIDKVLVPTWFYIIGDAIDRGVLTPVKGWNKTTWTTPKRITIDAGRDEKQARDNLESGRVTWEQDAAERGLDFDEQLAIRKRNARKILDASDYPKDKPIPLWMLYKTANQTPIVESQEEE